MRSKCLACLVSPTSKCRRCLKRLCSIHSPEEDHHTCKVNGMGCDIHAYLEVISKRDSDGRQFVDCVSEPSIGRDYDLFGRMAGVRGGDALVGPKGIPKDLSWRSQVAFTLRIDSDENASDYSGFVAETDKRNWINEWYDKERRLIYHPDWHTPSWLSTREFEECCEGYEAGTYPRILLASMIEIGKGRLGKARLVFWFDN